MKSVFSAEAIQEANLHQNWKDRRSIAKRIGGTTNYDIYQCNIGNGRNMFYIVRGQTPVGYVSTWEDVQKDNMIKSTYITSIARRRGLGTLAYQTIIRTSGKLISDTELSEGAHALWNKLQTLSEFTVTQVTPNQYAAVLLKPDIN